MFLKKDETLGYLKTKQTEELKRFFNNHLDFKQFAAVANAGVSDIAADVKIAREIYERGGSAEYVPPGLDIHHLPALAVQGCLTGGYEREGEKGIKYHFSPWSARAGWYAVMKNSRIDAEKPALQMKAINELAASLGIDSGVLIPDIVTIVFLLRKMEKINNLAVGDFLPAGKSARTGTVLSGSLDNSNEYVVFLKTEKIGDERYLSLEPRQWESNGAVLPIFRIC